MGEFRKNHEGLYLERCQAMMSSGIRRLESNVKCYIYADFAQFLGFTQFPDKSDAQYVEVTKGDLYEKAAKFVIVDEAPEESAQEEGQDNEG